MRVGIDLRYLSHGLMGGVHTYVLHLVPALARVAAGEELFFYADTKRPFEIDPLPANATLRLLPYRSPVSILANDLSLRRVMAADRLDVVHFPANYGFGPAGTRSVITLHDEINLLPLRKIYRGHRKDVRTLAMMTYLHAMSSASVRRCDHVITVSNHARSKILATGAVDPGRISAVHSAAAPDLARVVDPVTREQIGTQFALARPFVLADALKNPATLLRAWARLDPVLRSSYDVVFFSRTPAPPTPVLEAAASGTARLLVRPTRNELITLFSMASAFVFPSWIEGFGIPLLEAMTCGAPVIASDRGSIPEIAGDAALLADAEDDARFARHLTAVLADGETAQRLQARGYARAATFTWDKTARNVFEIYRSLAESRSVAAVLA